MKYFETHYEEYLLSSDKLNLHPKLETDVFSRLPHELKNLPNLILYGKTGIGKYTQALRIIRKYSPSDLKYEKKLMVLNDKKEYYYKISDVHYEVDMSQLGCNSKIVWHEVYDTILNIVEGHGGYGIIMCKNFGDIHSELLENFKSYTVNNRIKYLLISESVSFIPKELRDIFDIISIPNITKTLVKKFQMSPPSAESTCYTTPNTHPSALTSNKKPTKLHCKPNTHTIFGNLKELKHTTSREGGKMNDDIINAIIRILDNSSAHSADADMGTGLKYMELRDAIYDMMVYGADVASVIWQVVVRRGSKGGGMGMKEMGELWGFLYYHNNNYRPIYHIERVLLRIGNQG